MISIKRFLIAYNKGIETFFYLEVKFLKTSFQAYTILVEQYVPFFDAKYLDL